MCGVRIGTEYCVVTGVLKQYHARMAGVPRMLTDCPCVAARSLPSAIRLYRPVMLPWLRFLSALIAHPC